MYFSLLIVFIGRMRGGERPNLLLPFKRTVRDMGGASSSSLSDEQLKSQLQGMDDYDFEHLIADLWERQGWRTEVKQQSADRGVDVVAERDDPFPQKWLIQAKCYSNTVGGPEVRQYVSLQHRPGVDGAIVVSSGPFSKQARQEEKDHNLKLIDGDALISMIRKTDSYDLVDQYITVERTIGSQISDLTSFGLSYSSQSTSSESSYSPNRVSTDPSNWDSDFKESEDLTRLQEYSDEVQTGRDVEGGIKGVTRILFESPPKGIWWKAIVASSGYWILLFLVAGSLNSGPVDSLMAIGMLISWPLMPIAIYKDSKVAPKYTANWRPHRWLYILASAIPLGGMVTGPTYLAFRWWYGSNRELDDVEERRNEFRELFEDLDYKYN